MKTRLLLVLLFYPLLAAGQEAGAPADSALHRQIGQMIMAGFRGLALSDSMPVAEDLREGRLGGVILFDYDVPSDSALRNIRSPEQLRGLTRGLQRRSAVPLLIAVDQEGGTVSRLKSRFGFPPTVPARHLGAQAGLDSTRRYARLTARTLEEAGINMNLAPVVDLNRNPDNPVIGALGRSFSAEPAEVVRHARAWIRAHRRRGIITSLKHFPGHGSSEGDSHLGVVDVSESWHRDELIPYRELIGEGLADAVMTAHIFNSRLDPRWPATLSERTISGVLRDSLGFGGVVISDDLQMKAIRGEYGLETTIRRCLRAGVDLLVFANNSVYEPMIARRAHAIIAGLVARGEVSRERIRRSYSRIMDLKREYGLLEER